MKKFMRTVGVCVLTLIMGLSVPAVVFATNADAASEGDIATGIEQMDEENMFTTGIGGLDTTEAVVVADSTGTKALAAALVVGLAAAAGAIGMGMAISKSAEGISRQPEAEGKIRTTLMLGLVFVETAIIYALIVAILIIFVM